MFRHVSCRLVLNNLLKNVYSLTPLAGHVLGTEYAPAQHELSSLPPLASHALLHPTDFPEASLLQAMPDTMR